MSLLDSGAIGRYHADMGGATGEAAAKKAAALQEQGFAESSAKIEQGYTDAAGNYTPYIQPGMDAFNRMAAGSTPEGFAASLESLQASPAIQALIKQKMQGVNNQLSSAGLSRSGYGSQEMGAVTPETLVGLNQMLYGRSQNVAGMGYGATQAKSGLDVDKTNALVQMIMGKYGARASGVLGAAQAQVQGSQNRYTAMHNAGSAVMGMFGGGGGGGTSAPQGGTTSTVDTGQGQQSYQPSYGYDQSRDMRF